MQVCYNIYDCQECKIKYLQLVMTLQSIYTEKQTLATPLVYILCLVFLREKKVNWRTLPKNYVFAVADVYTLVQFGSVKTIFTDDLEICSRFYILQMTIFDTWVFYN